ncbi:MAG: helix-turn-helix domain-containing protein [Bacteroides sp.]|nr:helix-turn-helix domain-containing protein [Prevotella sp.]MCM1408724.1 helix-turn-helix domain-containing protein [Treponema brennaborense]MCM1470639.1 helix-turn-helix domain-containing protein [Bacteroides sp.]
MDAVEVGKRIRLFREKKGFTQSKLATLAGISPTYIYQIESGAKCPTVEYLSFVVCDGLDMTLASFFADTPSYTAEHDKVSELSPKQKRLLNDFLNSL